MLQTLPVNERAGWFYEAEKRRHKSARGKKFRKSAQILERFQSLRCADDFVQTRVWKDARGSCLELPTNLLAGQEILRLAFAIVDSAGQDLTIMERYIDKSCFGLWR